MRSAILLMTLCCLMGMTAAGCKSTMDGLESDIRTVLKKMEMDRFQDTTAGHKQSRPGGDSYSLTIQPVPEDSSISIVDLEETYYPGMKLEPGEYEIIVQHAGYEDFREWINLENDITIDVVLNKEDAAVAVKKPTYPARKTLPGEAVPEVKSAQVQAEAQPRPGSVPAVLSGHKELVTSLSFGPDGRLLASGSYDNTVILWNMPEGSRLRTLTHDDRLRAVAFSPDGKVLATGGNAKNVFLWDVETGTLINTFRGLSGRINCIEFSPDGLFLAAGSINEAIIWRVNNNRTEAHMLGDGEFYPRFGAINAIAFHPKGADADGFTLAFTCQKGVALYKPDTKEIIILPDDTMPNSLAYSPDGRYITWGARHQHGDNLFFPRFVLTDTRESDETISRADPNALADRVFLTTYTPGGNQLILLSYGQAVLYDIKTGDIIQTFGDTSQTAVTDAALSPNGKILAATAGNLIRLFTLD
jgi:WD40 repeat protein